MKRLTAKQRVAFREIGDHYLSLRFDWDRRLRNATYALAGLDSRWMVWVEREISPRWNIQKTTRIIEARARTLLLKRYAYFRNQKIGWLIFRDDQPFTDQGNLSPG